MKYVLSFDIGTSGLKTSLLDENFKLVGAATVAYTTYYDGEKGAATQNPEDWWKAAIEATSQIRELYKDEYAQVEVIGLSGHMTGCTVLDANGEPLMPSMIHADTRSGKQYAWLDKEFGTDFFYKMCGNVLSASMTISKILWIKENRPDVYEKAAVFFQSKDYLVYRLTGNLHSSDCSDASHGGLLDIAKEDYDPEVIKAVGIDINKLPKIQSSCDLAGHLTDEAAKVLGLKSGIAVSVGGGDGVCACTGAGVSEPGQFYLSLGTCAWVSGITTKPFLDDKHRLFTIQHLDGKNSVAFCTMECAGSSVKWIQRVFDTKKAKEVDRMAANVARGADGLIYLPYLEGERSPIFDHYARGVFFGISAFHNKDHFNRAVLEGVANGIAQNIDVLREREVCDEIRIIGGGAASKFWKQIIADMANVKVIDIAGYGDSATSVGAAAAAAVGVGMASSLEEVARKVETGDVILPNPEAVEEYALLKKKYRMLYPALKETFHTVE